MQDTDQTFTTQVQTYLYFDGKCDEALAFYRDTVGAEILQLMRYRDMPLQPGSDTCVEQSMPPGCEDKVLHCSFRIGATELMASDGFCAGKPVFEGFALSLVLKDKDTVERTFARLAEGGEVRVPVDKTFFSPAFGLVVDRYGILWNVLAVPPCNN